VKQHRNSFCNKFCTASPVPRLPRLTRLGCRAVYSVDFFLVEVLPLPVVVFFLGDLVFPSESDCGQGEVGFVVVGLRRVGFFRLGGLAVPESSPPGSTGGTG